ncbi:MAG: acyltransferase [Myxococcota bacterium]
MAAADHEAFRRRRYFGSLDGVRALSIVAVVWHHSDQASADAPLFFQRGFLGVDMFFVLSGFLIVTLLLREREREGTISLVGFYGRRSLRIFPLFYALLFALSLLAVARPASSLGRVWFDELPYVALYLANWVEVSTMMAIAWSLAAEEQFYLFWPPLERFAPSLAMPVLVGVVALSEAIQIGWLDGPLEAAVGWGPDEPEMLRGSTFAPILLGVLLAHAMHGESGFRAVRRLVGHRLAPVALGLAILGTIAAVPPDIRGWARPTIHLLMMLFLASLVVREDHALRRPMGWWAVRRIGIVSYGMYLLHMIATDLVGRALGASGLDFPGDHFLLSLALTWGMAELSFAYFEKPFLRMKSRFSARSATPRRA